MKQTSEHDTEPEQNAERRNSNLIRANPEAMTAYIPLTDRWTIRNHTRYLVTASCHSCTHVDAHLTRNVHVVQASVAGVVCEMHEARTNAQQKYFHAYMYVMKSEQQTPHAQPPLSCISCINITSRSPKSKRLTRSPLTYVQLRSSSSKRPTHSPLIYVQYITPRSLLC